MVILPVDQGFEHGPARQLRGQPGRLRPALPLPAGASTPGSRPMPRRSGRWRRAPTPSPGQIPTILKVNSSNSLLPAAAPKTQAITASVDDALRLGCAAIGFTIYPGSVLSLEMFEDIAEMREGGRRQGRRDRHLVLSARRGSRQERRDGHRRDRLRRSHRGAARRAHHQGEALDRPPGSSPRRRRSTPPRRSTSRPARRGSRTGPVLPRRPADRGVLGRRGQGRATRSRGRARHPQGGGNGSIIGRNAFQRPARRGAGAARPAGGDLPGLTAG